MIATRFLNNRFRKSDDFIVKTLIYSTEKKKPVDRENITTDNSSLFHSVAPSRRWKKQKKKTENKRLMLTDLTSKAAAKIHAAGTFFVGL